jgi:hypothetical protein
MNLAHSMGQSLWLLLNDWHGRAGVMSCLHNMNGNGNGNGDVV